jgi:hypothetical protein
VKAILPREGELGDAPCQESGANTKDIDTLNDKFLIIFGFPWKR